ncbi:hypothetical protein BBJ28_00026547, partial [Nothophytophthora sp. Chile5]
MAPLPSNQTPDVQDTPAIADAYAMNDDFDKAENGYAGMPATPKATTAFAVAGKPQGLARFAVQSVHMRECFAEFLGTFMMILFGMGVNNQVTNS